MDLDGTQIDLTISSLNERNIILNHLPAANAEDLISEAEEYTLSHPLEFSWTVDARAGQWYGKGSCTECREKLQESVIRW